LYVGPKLGIVIMRAWNLYTRRRDSA